MRPRGSELALACVFSLAIPCALPVRSVAQEMPPPPKLDKGADPRDWESYFDYGVKMIKRAPDKADAAFYWATRMDPTRAEPIYGRWVAFWQRNISEFEDYLLENKRVLAEAKVIASDSIRYRAYQRNPFVNQALLMVLLEQIQGGWGSESYARGWYQYANQYYPEALKDFYTALAKDGAPMTVRYDIALVYSQMQRYDSAAAQMEQLLELVKEEKAKTSSRLYESNEMYEYALGLLYEARGKVAPAREAQGRALQENLAFAPAHVALGRLASSRGDVATAVSEYALAADLAPADGAIQYWYGLALVEAKRASDGVAHLRKATQLEPYYAQPYYTLGAACAIVYDTAGAVAAYTDFIKRAPQSAANDVATAKERISKLGGKAP